MNRIVCHHPIARQLSDLNLFEDFNFQTNTIM